MSSLGFSLIAFCGCYECIHRNLKRYEALEVVGIPVAVKDFHPSIAEHAKYVTQIQGGKGAVREVCDLVHSLIFRGD